MPPLSSCCFRRISLGRHHEQNHLGLTRSFISSINGFAPFCVAEDEASPKGAPDRCGPFYVANLVFHL